MSRFSEEWEANKNNPSPQIDSKKSKKHINPFDVLVFGSMIVFAGLIIYYAAFSRVVPYTKVWVNDSNIHAPILETGSSISPFASIREYPKKHTFTMYSVKTLTEDAVTITTDIKVSLYLINISEVRLAPVYTDVQNYIEHYILHEYRKHIVTLQSSNLDTSLFPRLKFDEMFGYGINIDNISIHPFDDKLYEKDTSMVTH